jgi:hypothetical protein
MHYAINTEFYRAMDGQVSANEAADNMKRAGDAALAQAAR